MCLDAFYIGKYLVTNAEYARFVECAGRRPPNHWPEGRVPRGKEDHLVVWVTWYDAREYAAWAGMRLPTEAEWEKAASWDEGSRAGFLELRKERGRKRKYLWGDEFDRSLCNTNESRIGDTTPVGRYSPRSDSAYGCADMAGNVWEWTSSLKEDYPYRVDDWRESVEGSGSRIVRGGSWDLDEGSVRAAYRFSFGPSFAYVDFGFRCARSGSEPFPLARNLLGPD